MFSDNYYLFEFDWTQTTHLRTNKQHLHLNEIAFISVFRLQPILSSFWFHIFISLTLSVCFQDNPLAMLLLISCVSKTHNVLVKHLTAFACKTKQSRLFAICFFSLSLTVYFHIYNMPLFLFFSSFFLNCASQKSLLFIFFFANCFWFL